MTNRRVSNEDLFYLVICGTILFSYFLLPWIRVTLSVFGETGIDMSASAFGCFFGMTKMLSSVSQLDNELGGYSHIMEYYCIFYIYSFTWIILPVFSSMSLWGFFLDRSEQLKRFGKSTMMAGTLIGISMIVIKTWIISFITNFASDSFDSFFGSGSSNLFGTVTGSILDDIFGLGVGFYVIFLVSVGGLVILMLQRKSLKSDLVSKENHSNVIPEKREIRRNQTNLLLQSQSEQTYLVRQRNRDDFDSVLELKGESENIIVRDFPKVIGGNRQKADILLHDNAVSRKHAEVALTLRGVAIKDLNSTNGTRINGSKINPGVWYQLVERDTLKMGNLTFRVHMNQEALETIIKQQQGLV